MWILRPAGSPAMQSAYWLYLGMFAATIEIYRDSGPVLGNPRVMAAKVYWDDFTYWSFICQYFFRRLYKLPAAEHARFEVLANAFGALQRRAQHLLSQWARRGPTEPAALVDRRARRRHRHAPQSRSPDRTPRKRSSPRNAQDRRGRGR